MFLDFSISNNEMLDMEGDEESIGKLLHKRAKLIQDDKPDIETIEDKIIRKLLKRDEHEFKRNARDINFDPTSLKVVTSDVTKGFTSLDNSEQKILQNVKGLNIEEIASAERLVSYLEMMTRLQTAHRIQERTTQQWKQLFRK